MATVDKYNLKWNDFESGLLSGFQDIRKCQQFFDVTLVCEESRIQAHKVSSCAAAFAPLLLILSDHSENTYMTEKSVCRRLISVHFLDFT